MAPTTHDTVYKGSCHCQFFTYAVQLNLSTPDARSGAIITKCNCTICVKSVPGTLKILTPPKGTEEMSEYTFDQCRIRRYFCPKCGIECILDGEVEHDGKKVPVQRINVLTLDGREDGKEMVELKSIKVKYFAGRDEQWTRGLADEPYERGTW